MVGPRVCSPKGKTESADVVRRFGPQYAAQHGDRMMPSRKKALSDIAACCTRELGGRLYRCDDCDDTFWRYHCCRNRACPKCHGSQARLWLEQRQAELLPCDYFHAVVTVPRQLRAVFRRNQKLMYGLLMQVSAAAVKDRCSRKRHLGASPGMLSVLHTWNGRLDYHPHVHLLITGGGITADGQHWEPARREFLVPVAVLSRAIATQFRAALEAEASAIFAEVPASVWQREWVSFCKHYGHGNDAVLNYLVNSRSSSRADADRTLRPRQTTAIGTPALPHLAAKRFVQMAFPIGVPMGKALSVSVFLWFATVLVPRHCNSAAPTNISKSRDGFTLIVVDEVSGRAAWNPIELPGDDGPDFESGASAMNVALETGWADS